MKILNSFIAHKSINLLNGHYAIRSLADNLAGIFMLIYLYKSGLLLWQVFIVFAATLILRMLTRPFSLRLALKIGLKKSLIMGTFGYSGLFQVLYFVNGISSWLVFYIFYAALVDTLYWLPYHAYFASIGQNKHSAKHVAVREAFVSFGSTFIPALGAFLIVFYNFYILFAAATLLVLLSLIPIFAMRDVSLENNLGFLQSYKKINKTGFWLFIGDGCYTVGFYFIWPLIIFLLFDSYITYGWILVISLIAQAIGFLVLGNLVDKGHHSSIYKTAILFGILVTAGQALFAFSLNLVILFSFAGYLTRSFYFPPLFNVLYNSARESKNPLWFHFFAEIGWDIGAVITSLVGALVAYFDLSLRIALLFSIVGLLFVGSVKKVYYKSLQKIY